MIHWALKLDAKPALTSLLGEKLDSWIFSSTYGPGNFGQKSNPVFFFSSEYSVVEFINYMIMIKDCGKKIFNIFYLNFYGKIANRCP